MEYIVYKGNKYNFQQGYYRRIVQLHRQIWEDNFGPIPENHQIHHKNGNTTDNRIENLECLSLSDHRRLHNLQKETHYQRCKLGSRLSERKKRAWYLLKSGKNIKSENSKMFWDERQKENVSCVICGKDFSSRSVKIKNRCCSNACRCFLYRMNKVRQQNDPLPPVNG